MPVTLCRKKLTKSHVFVAIGSVANARLRHNKLTIKYLKVVTGLWHSAEKKLTKCQVFREVGSAANARHRHNKLTIKYLKVVTGLWRSGSAEDS